MNVLVFISHFLVNLVELKEKISEYKDFPKKGILFRDFSPILKDPSALSFVIDEFSKKFHPNDIDVIYMPLPTGIHEKCIIK